MKVAKLELTHLDVPFTPHTQQHLGYWLPHWRIVQVCKLNTWMSTENCTTFGMTCAYVDGLPTCIEECDAGPDSGEDTDTDADGGADAHAG